MKRRSVNIPDALDQVYPPVEMRPKLSYSQLFKLWFKTIFYHTSFSRDYVMDTLVEPLFWIIDHFVVFLGRFFVFMVVFLVGSIIVIAHLIGIPVYLEISPRLTTCMFGVGYWIILNLFFNFIQAVRVSPGLPNNPREMTSSVSVCKKCISPKPARTHHCSICNRCYLNMDHHCPWINNCVGHFNRRYFYLTMVFIVTGCLYVMILGLSLAFRQVVQGEDILPFKDFAKESMQLEGPHSPAGNIIDTAIPGDDLEAMNLSSLQEDAEGNNKTLAGILATILTSTEQAELMFGVRVTRTILVVMLYYVALITIGASLALGGLVIWHGKLITRGETSIEYHVNKAEQKRLGEKFINPYNLGWRKNWELFFGLDQRRRSFWRHILFPSAHVPTGNGYDWSFITRQTMEPYDSLKQL